MNALLNWSRLFRDSLPVTRFNTASEVKTINFILQKLRYKKNELEKKSLIKGADSLEAMKHLIISRLLIQIDGKIDKFNKMNFETKQEEVKDLIIILHQLGEEVLFVIEKFSSVLKLERNNYRVFWDNVLGYTTYGAVYSTGTALSFSLLGTGALLLFVAPTVSKATRNFMGTTAAQTKSLMLIGELFHAIRNCAQQMDLKQYWRALPKNQDGYPCEFICPITSELMRKPVTCTLDGQTYEEEAIRKWLLDHRTSPCNRLKMQDDQSVDSVLTPNRSLQSLMDKFSYDHLEIKQGANPAPRP